MLITTIEAIIKIRPVRILPYPVRKYTEEEVDEFFDFDRELSKKLKKWHKF